MKLKPLRDRVIVDMEQKEETTESGLVVPEAAKDDPNEGRVQAVGSDVTTVQVGDIVIVPKYLVSVIEIDDTRYTILDEDEILAVKED